MLNQISLPTNTRTEGAVSRGLERDSSSLVESPIPTHSASLNPSYLDLVMQRSWSASGGCVGALPSPCPVIVPGLSLRHRPIWDFCHPGFCEESSGLYTQLPTNRDDIGGALREYMRKHRRKGQCRCDTSRRPGAARPRPVGASPWRSTHLRAK